MKAIQYNAYGGVEQMHLTDRVLPSLKAAELLVEVHAASVNPVDLKIRRGEMKLFTGTKFPRGMGSDFAGTVTQSNSPRFKAGDAVFGFVPFKDAQTFAEQAIVSTELTYLKPEHLSFEEAACLPMAGTAALRALLEKGALQSGNRVLVIGCTGGVGMMAVQIAKANNANVTGTCSASDLALAKSLGADEVLDYKKTSLSDFSGPYDIVFDTVGIFTFGQIKPLLTQKGIFLELNPKPFNLLFQLFNSRLKPLITQVRQEDLAALAKLASEHHLRPVIGQTVSLDQAIQTLADFEQGKRVVGKTVIQIP